MTSRARSAPADSRAAARDGGNHRATRSRSVNGAAVLLVVVPSVAGVVTFLARRSGRGG